MNKRIEESQLVGLGHVDRIAEERMARKFNNQGQGEETEGTYREKHDRM